MTTLSISPPFPLITDIDGQPLEDGYIWIGAANLPPIGNPITVYWDAALTQPAVQPIRTQGGYPVYQGTPARIYINGTNYSIRVMNKNGLTVYTAPPGSINTSNTASAILNAIDTAGTFMATGVPAPARAVLSEASQYLKDRKVKARIKDALRQPE